MIINHKSNAETGGKSAHRPGGIFFHYLLTGNDDAKDNFVLALVETTDDYNTPRHRHNFEQVRFMLDGSFEYEPGQVQEEGSVGYFCEGVHYTQKGMGHSVALILQLGGASGHGYMSHRTLRQASAELAKTGVFNDGTYVWKDEKGQEHSKDGYEATWEYVRGKPVEYPAARYERPIVFMPENFSYLPARDAAGVEIKELGRFNERGLEIKQIRMRAGANYRIGSEERSYLVYVQRGEGSANDEKWGAESAFQAEKGEQVVITTNQASEFFVIGLPSFED